MGATLRREFFFDAYPRACSWVGGFLDEKHLTELKGGTGYVNVALDIFVLIRMMVLRMMRERWNDIVSKSAIQLAELLEAEQVAQRVRLAYAEHSQQAVAVSAAQDERQRAFTLLIRTYSQARRAATYLFWEQPDLAKVAPSLWAGRGGRGSSDNGTEPAAAPAPNGDAPVVAPSPSPGPVPTQPTVPTEAGLPGGSPFANS